jgi:hypothetical protein
MSGMDCTMFFWNQTAGAALPLRVATAHASMHCCWCLCLP